jgi:hypothetical protein
VSDQSTPIHVSSVERLGGEPPEQLLAFEIEEPSAGTREAGYSLRLSGWIVGRDGPPPPIRVTSRTTLPDGRVFRRWLADVKRNVARPDVAARFREDPQKQTGFLHSVSLLGLGREFELGIDARAPDGDITSLASIRGRRDLVQTSYAPVMQPLLLSTIGRAGSTWMTHLLGQHPEIVTYRPFELEASVSTYWGEVLRHLAKPDSYGQALSAERPMRGAKRWWLGDRRRTPPQNLGAEPEIARWLDKRAIDDFASFCQSRIDGFYEQVALAQSKPRPRYFVERAGSWRATTIITELYRDHREVFLVRDFRDVLCSRLAFMRNTRAVLFNRQLAETDEDYVRTWMAREARTFRDLWAQKPNAYLVRYEDLVQRPEVTLSGLFGYLQAADDPNTVEEVLRRARELFADRQARHKTTPDEDASIGRWRRELDGPLLDASAEALNEALSSFGYEV